MRARTRSGISLFPLDGPAKLPVLNNRLLEVSDHLRGELLRLQQMPAPVPRFVEAVCLDEGMHGRVFHPRGRRGVIPKSSDDVIGRALTLARPSALLPSEEPEGVLSKRDSEDRYATAVRPPNLLRGPWAAPEALVEHCNQRVA